ncbi:L-aspartate oxidase [Bacteroidota bacterium]
MIHRFDFLIIGSGIAGLSFALRAAEHGTVGIVTKKDPAESSTNYAQGGVAAVVAEDDSFALHEADTLEAGAGLCNPDIVRIVVHEGPDRIRELIEMGAKFSSKGSQLDLGREGGHSRNRIVHAKDRTGREIERTLLASVSSHPNIQLYPYHFALELLTEHHLGQSVTRVRPDTHCFGAYVLDEEKDRVDTFLAKSTLLAAGGAGEAYLHTTNPAVATGDGIAMAYRAKSRLANMEFVQFHPTALWHPDANRVLISEAVRGAGAILVNQDGERFMTRYDERAELAPRDIVARAIDNELKVSGHEHVWLDISHRSSAEILDAFPAIAETCLGYGFDTTKGPVPVVPAAHYMCGGVVTDAFGRTSIQNLFACGEVTCTGLHGANRLASNSLVEALVFSRRALEPAVEAVRSSSWSDGIPDWDDSGTQEPGEWVLISHNRQELQRIMSDYVGIVRSTLRLERAQRRLRLLYEETEDFYHRVRVSARLCELRNLIAVGYLIVRSASMRKESRGLHYTTDYPELDPGELRDTLI